MLIDFAILSKIKKGVFLQIFNLRSLVLMVSFLSLVEGGGVEDWYGLGEKAIADKLKQKTFTTKRGAAKNIILFIGDGMGLSTVTATRIYAGQLRGESGEENILSFGKFPVVGLSKTYNTDSQTPDSAGTMTAIITGVKTKKGMLSVSSAANVGECNSSKGNELRTALELAEMKGLATGIVTTTRLTHATPAATYAHAASRKWEHNSSIGDGCKDIASQFIDFSYGDGIEVAMGGGRREFMSNTAPKVEGKSGKRTDGRDLREEWKAKHPKGVYVETKAEFDAIDVTKTKKLLALFNPSHMHYEADRKNDKAGEPSLSEMTKKAIEVLKKSKKGFFLMVEGGRIDHAHHAGSAFNALTETAELAKAVAVADTLTNDNDTLIVVTADHSHVFTMAGYPVRGNPILGKVKESDGKGGDKGYTLGADGKPFTTLGYANGRGVMDLKDETNADESYNHEIHKSGRVDLTHVDTEATGFHQEATVPYGYETHGGEDVGIYAKGPGSILFTGTNEQNVIFHVIERMADLQKR
jgi:alkaline phosphatase